MELKNILACPELDLYMIVRTGPKRSEVILNWLLPMAINALDGADMPETTRPVL